MTLKVKRKYKNKVKDLKMKEKQIMEF